MAHKFQVFAYTWGFVHTYSSPYNSRFNGKAESAVKMCPDPRHTPTSGMGSSPNQRLFSTRTRGGLVTSQERLKPEIQGYMWVCKIRKQQTRQGPAKVQLEPIHKWVSQCWFRTGFLRKSQWNRGMCVDQLSDRSYMVVVDDQIFRRNRVFLRPSSIHQPDVDAEDRMSDQRPTKGATCPKGGVVSQCWFRTGFLRKSQWNRGTCVDQLSDRSYMVVVIVDDQIFRRNRVFLRPSSIHQPDVDAEDRMSDQRPTKGATCPKGGESSIGSDYPTGGQYTCEWGSISRRVISQSTHSCSCGEFPIDSYACHW